MRAEFGARKTIISGSNSPKILQSPKSKHAHFKRKICKHCNSTRTQAADRAFDYLHIELKQLLAKGLALTDHNNVPNIELSPEVRTDVFRYFAKILCCFLVEVGGPRSKSISEFALSISNRNPILLTILEDTQYEANLEKNNTLGFLEHGGLKLRFDDQKLWVNSIESSISAAGIKYIFSVVLSRSLQRELHFEHHNIIGRALENIIEDE